MQQDPKVKGLQSRVGIAVVAAIVILLISIALNRMACGQKSGPPNAPPAIPPGQGNTFQPATTTTTTTTGPATTRPTAR